MTLQNVLKYLGGFIVAAAVIFLMWYFSSIVIYILVAAVLAVIGGPVVDAISSLSVKEHNVPRWLSSAVVLILFWVIFFLLCSLLLPLVANKIYQLSMLDFSSVLNQIEEPVLRVQEYIASTFGEVNADFSLNEALAEWLHKVINMRTVNSAFSSIVSGAVDAVIAFFSISFITFFFLRERSLFADMVKALFPEKYGENISRAISSIKVLLSRYFVGILSESAIIMILVSVVMMLFGMAAENAIFTGLIMGVMNVVPYAGPVIGGLISVFMGVVSPIEGMSVGHTVAIIVCSLMTIKGVDDFIIQPTLYSERVKAHPLEVFLVILIAGSVAGIVGMLLAIPLYTVIRVFAKEFFSQFKLVQKLTENI